MDRQQRSAEAAAADLASKSYMQGGPDAVEPEAHPAVQEAVPGLGWQRVRDRFRANQAPFYSDARWTNLYGHGNLGGHAVALANTKAESQLKRDELEISGLVGATEIAYTDQPGANPYAGPGGAYRHAGLMGWTRLRAAQGHHAPWANHWAHPYDAVPVASEQPRVTVKPVNYKQGVHDPYGNFTDIDNADF